MRFILTVPFAGCAIAVGWAMMHTRDPEPFSNPPFGPMASHAQCTEGLACNRARGYLRDLGRVLAGRLFRHRHGAEGTAADDQGRASLSSLDFSHQWKS